MPERFRWLFFDLDGTLADSIPAMFRVYRAFLDGYGVQGTQDEFDALNGPSLTEIVTLLKARHQLPGEPHALETRYRELIRHAYQTDVHPMKGADLVLKTLSQKGFSLFLVTSGGRENATAFVQQRNWSRYFRGMVCGEEVSRAKPSPEIYERALKVAGASGGEVAVVEDSPNGVLAAKRAGLFVFGLTDAGADRTLAELEELLPRLGLTPETEEPPQEIVAIGSITLRIIRDAGMEAELERKRPLIRQLWENARTTSGGRLFNGTLPSLIRVDRHAEGIDVVARMVEYQDLMAQRMRPELGLGIQPVGVSGVIVLRDGGREFVVFARRGRNVTEYSGFLETVPSGSIEQRFARDDGAIDYGGQLLAEFTEETGLPADIVDVVVGFALVRDTSHQVYDICCRLLCREETPVSFIERFRSSEYTAPCLVAMDELEAFLRSHDDEIVPSSKALLDAYRRQFIR